MADLQIVAGLDVEKSARLIENQIKNELPNNIQNTSLKVAVGLDITKTTEMINQQLSNLQGITIKNLNIDAGAIENIQKQATTVTNKVVTEFNKMFSIPSRGLVDITKGELNSKIKDLLKAFQSNDVEKSNTALTQLTEIIRKQSKVVTEDGSELEKFRDVLRSMGKVKLDENVMSWLEKMLGTGKELKAVLTTVFGVGNYNSSNSALKLDTWVKQNDEIKKYGENAEAIVKIYEHIQNLKNGLTPTDFFSAIGNSVNATEYVRNYLNELLKIDSTTKSVTNSNNATQKSFESLESRLNSEGRTLKVTTAELEKLKSMTFDNGMGRYFENADGSVKQFIVDTQRIKDIIVEDNQALQSMDKVVANVSDKTKILSSDFANLSNVEKAIFYPKYDNNGLIDAVSTLDIVRERFQGLNNVVTTGNFFGGQLNGIAVSMKNTDGEAKRLYYSLKQLDDETEIFVLNSAKYNDKGIEQQLSKAESKAVLLSTTLEKVKAKYTDINAPKSIKVEENLVKLETEFNKVKTAIDNVKNANLSNMTQLEAEAKKAVSEYERLAVSLQNAEYMATSLRTKDIGTIWVSEIETLEQFKIKVTNSKVPVSELQKEIISLETALGNVSNTNDLINYLNTFDDIKAKFKTLNEQYKATDKAQQENTALLKQQYQEYSKTRIELESLEKGTKSYSEKLKQLKEKRDAFSQTAKQGIQMFGDDYRNNIESVTKAINSVTEAKIREKRVSQQDKAESQRIKEQEQALKQYGKTIDDTINKLNKQSNVNVFGKNSNDASVVAVRTTIEGLITKYNQLKSTMGEIKTPEQFKKFENELAILDSQFNKTIGYAKNLQKQFANDNSSVTLTNKIQTLRNQIERFMSNNGKAMNNGYRSQFDTLLNQLNTIANTGDFNKAKAQFQQLTNEINKLGLRGNSVMDSLKQKLTKFASWIGLTMITASVSREIRGMYSDIITLDTALVDLNKTFQGTSAELERVYNSANEIAKELGVTTEQVINQASAWSRLG